jgi:Protein of unknown function (DUF3443)
VRKLFFFVLLGSLGFAVGCGSSSGSTPAGIPGGGGGNSTGNVLSIAVDGGPTANQQGGTIFANTMYASATICAPGSTSSCVTVDHLLVDTGSYGLRVLQSAISSLNLPSLNASNGQPAYDCIAFVDLSYLWGPVMKADVTLAGETAKSLPIHVISSSTANIPASCSNGNTTGDENTQATLGANGILGVGLEPTDCFFDGGSACDPSSDVTPVPTPAYYTCNSLPCSPQYISVSNQVTNPVALFSVDNNGVIVELPSISGSAATVTGSLIFGVGTESNNVLASNATLFTTACNEFDTTFEGQAFDVDPSNCGGSGSFIDSGSNGLFFPDVNNVLPGCPANTPGTNFYCPPSLMNLSATNQDPNNGFTAIVNFSVDNANTLFASRDAAYSTLGGPNPSGSGFDWGAPFFYGRNVVSTIDGQAVPSGLPNAPWWAY